MTYIRHTVWGISYLVYVEQCGWVKEHILLSPLDRWGCAHNVILQLPILIIPF